MEFNLNVPVKDNILESLNIGDRVYLNGIIYTARDSAHKRMIEALDSGKDLPFEINGSFIYYVGPTPARPGYVIGSAGPTTSYRMDKYTPRLLDLGLKGMIGKGNRSNEVIQSIIKNKAIYFAATGGVGALISKCIVKSEIIAFEDLGPEAIRRLEVKNFPVIVVIDTKGKNLYEEGIKKYRIA
ncbi:MAG TPA: Fe-S-containing hydro-lyase [Thermodesulfobium narugense]|uniref:Fumarate hydratase subunit beta n=1 Tax=Thermodesulfobium acidiphilum TaxID=1794699 RepID=A0A2R4W293_THEAF|nr:Fe-S-containing hydro-lyase [Thermodesulfobium acidiphilum]AWB10913.1 fumarate hydratase subunit beta [Thermodesulfobium acidiphilum]PMP84764.1 MAG: fumarate hydratase [Thermodesulfobium narugense]HEM55492.1 Fe-S-containing hydro-lyase [Thermodesulfobium narugense]